MTDFRHDVQITYKVRKSTKQHSPDIITYADLGQY